MAIVRIDGTKITDWASFHIVCKEAFGFPSFYGENMDAFIDCLTYIDKEMVCPGSCCRAMRC
jgi:RNAse (barnase) inhibitor barstar